MDTYKPDMVKFELEGPLKFAEEFFDTISLTAVQKDQTLEVSGKILADALILASWTGQDSVEFPTDHDILEKILVNYRRDLDHLWEKLTKECRRVEPHRQSALRMAKKIWQDQGLPPKNLF